MHIEGLLHLAAMSAGIGVAYMGIDRIRGEADHFNDMLEEVTSRVKQLILRLDVKKTNTNSNGEIVGRLTKLREVYDRHPMHILCFVAEENIKLGAWRRFWLVVRRQVDIPLLGYFRKRYDRTVVSSVGMYSMFIFIVLTYMSVFDTQFKDVSLYFTISDSFIIKFIYYSLVLSLFLILFPAAISFKLHKLDHVCRSYESKVEVYVREIQREAIDAINRFDQP